jgi:hypothetical protein
MAPVAIVENYEVGPFALANVKKCQGSDLAALAYWLLGFPPSLSLSLSLSLSFSLSLSLSPRLFPAN